jgi:helicase
MTFSVLARADRSRIMLLPVHEGKTLFEAYLRLKDMPQGPRPFKFLIKREAEKYLPPEDAVRMLRRAGAIYLARGDSAMEEKFTHLLEAFQLSYKRVSVCGHCLGERRVTYVGPTAISYKGARICENCAARELLREADFRGLSRPAKAHLARLLKKRRSLDEVIGLLSLEEMPPGRRKGWRSTPWSCPLPRGSFCEGGSLGSCPFNRAPSRQGCCRVEISWWSRPLPPARA